MHPPWPNGPLAVPQPSQSRVNFLGLGYFRPMGQVLAPTLVRPECESPSSSDQGVRESQGRGSLLGCHLWGRKELDTTEQLN